MAVLPLPPNIEDALRWIQIFRDDDASNFIWRFRQRWGSYEEEALIRAVQHSEGRERVFAIYALGKTHTPAAQEILLPLLGSSTPQDRWASALCLGEVGAEEARPVLSKMLTQYLPTTVTEYSPGGATDYEHWRIAVPMLIGSLNDAWYVPALREALKTLINLLGQTNKVESSGTETMSGTSGDWLDRDDDIVHFSDDIFEDVFVNCQDEIVYALGRLGGFGVLTGVVVNEGNLYQWMVHMCMGRLHGRYSWADVLNRDPQSLLRKEVMSLLQSTFGLSNEEATQAYEAYMRAKSGFLAVKWQSEVERRE